MELKIRDKEEREPACEFWLEKNKDRIELMSKKEGESSRIEFSIKPDGNWIKCIAGNLKDEQRE